MDPFLGEVRIFPWSWAPRGWALCNGAAMLIQQNAALNALLGQTFGGNGTTTFNLPDLRGRTPVHLGRSPDGLTYVNGQTGGTETVTLTTSTLPLHTHAVKAVSSTGGNSVLPTNCLPAAAAAQTSGGVVTGIYGAVNSGPPILLNVDSLSSEGGGAAHNNMQPFLVMNFCIATMGLFPPRQ